MTPHCWLSLENAQIEVNNIADALAQTDPGNAEFYKKNAQDYTNQLQQLEDEYAGKFQKLSNKQFVTGHAAFAYLCRDLGLQQNSVESVFADGEPSTQQMARLTDYCRQHGVKTIFVEDMVSPKTSQTLANEVGATVKKIHTIETSEDGASYIDRMKENLDEIYNSMQ
jgi:zinc transport system substrate-binding protein